MRTSLRQLAGRLDQSLDLRTRGFEKGEHQSVCQLQFQSFAVVRDFGRNAVMLRVKFDWHGARAGTRDS